MTEPNRPLTEEEKQRKPMPGETSPEDAATKAREFAAQEKARLQKR
jgi:hypothetical protein